MWVVTKWKITRVITRIQEPDRTSLVIGMECVQHSGRTRSIGLFGMHPASGRMDSNDDSARV